MSADCGVPGGTFFPIHGKAVVDAAKKRQLAHEEMHSKVEYIVAHGISSYIDGEKKW